MNQYNLSSTPFDPTFNGIAIFNSIDPNNNWFCEGLLWTSQYSQIVQNLHFNGEVGDWRLFFGYPDMEWTFKGIISSSNVSFSTALNNFNAILQGIESQIDSSTPYTLTDSLGNYYHNAEIRKIIKGEFHKTQMGYVMPIQVMGIIHAGNTQEGATS